MGDTTLVKLGFSKIDKLCDASFVRKIFKSTKKDFALFVSENEDIKGFLESLEEKIEETNSEFQEMIQEYIESIPEDINKFKLKIKELQREKKQNAKEREKQLLREEILREMEAEKKKSELESKLGMKKEITFKKADEDKAKMLKKPKFKLKTTENKEAEIKTIEKAIDETIPSTKAGVGDSIDLAHFFAFLKEVVKNDLLIIKNDEGKLNIRDVDLDEDKIKIKVEMS
tara:strand:+ start:1214 stop:1900 length:687 start_codon:yes stop_codon:yes gene_type:complete